MLLHSPLAPRHRESLAARLGAAGVTIHVMSPEAPALGALHALRRNARGIPHYLDLLDQVALAVLGPSGPVFEDLIPPEATVPGNREYVSAPITSMVWPKEMKTAQFFIRKGAREIRTWTTPELTAPEENEQLDIRLRQKPAQGWANLLITAPRWELLRRAPIRLEWSALQVEPRSADDVLELLRGPPPVVPNPVHYSAHIGLWDGSLRKPGLGVLLERVRQGQARDLEALADALGSPYSLPASNGAGAMRFYAVGTDGSLPPNLDAATVRLLEDSIGGIAEDLMRRRRRGLGPANNDPLRCLTWCFVRCPPAVVDELAATVTGPRRGQIASLAAAVPRGRCGFPGTRPRRHRSGAAPGDDSQAYQWLDEPGSTGCACGHAVTPGGDARSAARPSSAGHILTCRAAGGDAGGFA